jgi:hypothetical protein
MRMSVVLVMAAGALGAFAASASANVEAWRVSVAGTYSSDATTTNLECGENYNVPMTGKSSESGTFKSKKATVFDAWHAGTKPELAIADDTKPWRLQGAITRTSEMAMRDEPSGCHEPVQTPACGTKAFTSQGTLYGIPVHRKLMAELGLDMNQAFKLDGGSWEKCPLGMGQAGMPFFPNPKDTVEGLNPPVRIPAAKLFARHARPFQVKGTLQHKGAEKLSPATTDWTYTFEFTLKFTPAGRA